MGVGDFGGISDKIAHAAERQHGHVTRRQLLGLGVGGGAITHRIAAGDLVVVHAGVYAIGYRRVEPVARAMAAVLACGAGAVLSHDSAAALWGLRRWREIPEVTARGHRRRPGIHTHRSRTLEADDVRVQLNVPTTSAARAIADIAARLSDKQLTRATQNARRAGHIKPTDLHKLLLRCPRLGDLVDPAQNPTRSGLEDTLIPWLDKHGLPHPEINAMINGHEVDALYEKEKVILELDSWEFHQDYPTWVSDRDRDGENLARGGYRTIRIIPERLTDAKADQLRTILRA
jgi:putative AbiEi antitoxin of type IV toxin-antitoxin system